MSGKRDSSSVSVDEEEVSALLVEQFGYFDGAREMAERIICNYMNIDVGR